MWQNATISMKQGSNWDSIIINITNINYILLLENISIRVLSTVKLTQLLQFSNCACVWGAEKSSLHITVTMWMIEKDIKSKVV